MFKLAAVNFFLKQYDPQYISDLDLPEAFARLKEIYELTGEAPPVETPDQAVLFQSLVAENTAVAKAPPILRPENINMWLVKACFEGACEKYTREGSGRERPLQLTVTLRRRTCT